MTTYRPSRTRPPRRERIRRRRVTVRVVRQDEAAELLAQVFAGMSPASRRARYLADLDELSPRAVAALSDLDPSRHVAVVAEVRRRGLVVPVGLGRFVRDRPTDAEIAYEVVDAWQGRGIGRLLVRRLAELARDAGVQRLHATIHRDNLASITLLRTELPAMRVRRDGQLVQVTADVGTRLTATDLLLDLGVPA